jgi:hypothetical protein
VSCYQAEAGLSWAGSGALTGEARIVMSPSSVPAWPVSAPPSRCLSVESSRFVCWRPTSPVPVHRVATVGSCLPAIRWPTMPWSATGGDVRPPHAWLDAVRPSGLVRERIERYGIDCEVNDAGVVLADWFGDDQGLDQNSPAHGRQLGFKLDFLDRDEAGRELVSSPRYGAGLFEPGSFHFHPLKHIRGLVRSIGSGRASISVHGNRRCTCALSAAADGWLVTTASGSCMPARRC